MTQNNLGNAWSNLPTEDRGRNIQEAIDCFQRALEIYTSDAWPDRHESVNENLGNAKRALDELETGAE